MNRTKLKNYAPKARQDFIQAMTDRAAFYGMTVKKVEPVVERGDVAVIAGREHPLAVAKKRKALEDRIGRQGFGPTMEAMAYTWFNRLVAIRFMELHGYLDHGYRVLSHPEGKPTPEIVEHAEHVELPGLKEEAVIDLKLAGNKEGALYRLLLTAQCNALHTAMPFLFERIEDETELLLPDNLLHSDSLIRKLVGGIDEEDWKEVEIIGWLYQFYISEKKDEVIGKVVASEDIPAATQLFTPNWIVKYLVQNTLGRQWLATYPQSALRQQMAYYIEPAEQTPEVQEHLKAITPTSLDPEEITFLDPACGSGHILVEAYDLFKAIYQERGYRAKDIPALILQKNLFGLEIDDRAAQLAAFALMMKARADDRRIFDSDGKPNILAFQDSRGMNAADITHALNSPINKEDVPSEYLFDEVEEEKAGLFSKTALAEKGHVSQGDISSLLALFENAKTFGSLIQIPPKLAAKLSELELRLDVVLKHGDLTHASAHVLKPLLRQARSLASRFGLVVANPPYMGLKYYIEPLKSFVNENFHEAKSDLYSAFIIRNTGFAQNNGMVGMITIPNWMFLSTFAEMRSQLVDTLTIDSFVHNGRGVWGSDFGSCSFVFRKALVPKCRGVYKRLFDKQGSIADNDEEATRFFTSQCFFVPSHSFRDVPGCQIAYWISDKLRSTFSAWPKVGIAASTKQGLITSDNDRFLRMWYEVKMERIGFGHQSREAALSSKKKWFPYNKGGDYRKWYGNVGYVVNWENDGSEIRSFMGDDGRVRSRPQNLDFYFRAAVSWSDITSGAFCARYFPSGFIFDATGPSAFLSQPLDAYALLLFANSPLAAALTRVINPSIHFQPGDCANLPFVRGEANEMVEANATELIHIAKQDWDSSETSWDFQRFPLAHKVGSSQTVEASFKIWESAGTQQISRMKELEEFSNNAILKACNLEGEMSPIISESQITLYRPDCSEDIKRLLSYAIGCTMGRYSLDKAGLIYAHGGNQGFDPGQYKTFRADDDGIIPLLETDWGIRDDATSRLVEFIGVAWPKEHLEENLKFITDSLGPNYGEQPRDTIRRYLATGFYKHHLQMYKRRPIYWLFSSGKQRAFQCLVYLHRYHEGTLARMRTEYVIPLQGQIAARIDQLEGDKAKATSTSHRKKLQKEQDDLKKQQAELLTFEEKLKHAADQKIGLDLDDGVKVNYGKFGDLLAEAKAICGSKEEE